MSPEERMAASRHIARVLHSHRERPSFWPDDVKGDCRRIRNQYEHLKRTMGFQEAVWRVRSRRGD